MRVKEWLKPAPLFHASPGRVAPCGLKRMPCWGRRAIARAASRPMRVKEIVNVNTPYVYIFGESPHAG